MTTNLNEPSKDGETVNVTTTHAPVYCDQCGQQVAPIDNHAVDCERDNPSGTFTIGDGSK